jgi:hypothetical protein
MNEGNNNEILNYNQRHKEEQYKFLVWYLRVREKSVELFAVFKYGGRTCSAFPWSAAFSRAIKRKQRGKQGAFQLRLLTKHTCYSRATIRHTQIRKQALILWTVFPSKTRPLTLWRTTTFNIKNYTVSPYSALMRFYTDSYYLPTQHQLSGFYNCDAAC